MTMDPGGRKWMSWFEDEKIQFLLLRKIRFNFMKYYTEKIKINSGNSEQGLIICSNLDIQTLEI